MGARVAFFSFWSRRSLRTLIASIPFSSCGSQGAPLALRTPLTLRATLSLRASLALQPAFPLGPAFALRTRIAFVPFRTPRARNRCASFKRREPIFHAGKTILE